MSEIKLQDLADRLVQIESAVAHLQHDIEGINTALSGYYRKVQKFEERFVHIEHELETLNQGAEERTLEDDKPPHY
ncbi:MAG: SlyX family protein [Fuerstiella sp.]